MLHPLLRTIDWRPSVQDASLDTCLHQPSRAAVRLLWQGVRNAAFENQAIVLASASMSMDLAGHEWIVDAFGCEPDTLRSVEKLQFLLSRIVEEAELTPLNSGFWHKFPGEGGVTGLIPLTESHLTLHTFPETGLATLNLYCCRSRCSWPFETRLAELLGADSVVVRHLLRGVL